MAYVVTQACIGNKHTDCVDVCPVEAFREGPDMLFIDPQACIECNACLTECPERAIYPQSAVPEEQLHFIALNAEQSQQYPVIRESKKHSAAPSPMAAFKGKFAVVGSGPSGFYAAEELLKQMPESQVDMFERLPTPFGLVRYGVAPDHPRIKSVTHSFENIAAHPQLRFFGNVHVGQDLTREDLLAHYDGVLYATGGSQSRALPVPVAASIEGQTAATQAQNIFGSSVFVGWYNGHPDQADLSVDVTHSSAVVIGAGNVALDVARLLVLTPEQLAATDMADEALTVLAGSAIEDVYILARRGAMQAAFTPKELEQLMALEHVDVVVNPEDLELDADALVQLEQPELAEARQNINLLRDIAQRPRKEGAGRKRIHFLFAHSPQSLTAADAGRWQLQAVRNAMQRNERGEQQWLATDTALAIEAGLVVHAIGYQGEAIDDVAFDTQRGVIANASGRVSGEAHDREYVAGWIKRGASGVIGSNKQCAQDSVAQLIDDRLAGDGLISRVLDAGSIESVLRERQIDFTDFADWQLLDNYEQACGRAEGRPRKKVVHFKDMLTVIREQRQQQYEREQAQAKQPLKTHLRSCTLCEAMCGIQIEYQGERIVSIAGDPEDPHSGGHICPKGYSLQDLHNDPDRLKTPLQKVNGRWLPIGWDEALDLVSEKLVAIQQQYGDDAIGAYWGNPSSHNFGLLMATNKFRKALGSRNLFTAASLDQLPHQLMSYLMFGHGQIFTIPDIDHTDYLLMLGANPAASNGSLMSSGDVLKRLESIGERGGKWVLVDPRKNESSLYASEHQFIRPGTDPLFLLGLIKHIIAQGLVKVDRLSPMLDGLDRLLSLFDDVDMQAISDACGISVLEIQRIAEEFAGAERAICYGRMGISTQDFAALNHWLINVLNILTGNLDRRGGMMFTNPAVDMGLKPSAAGSYASYHSRVRGLPEFNREFPAAIMAEEMLTEGDGQIKAFIGIAGNPVLSSPNGRQLDRAMEQLEFQVAIDFYLNETSRHADVILPPTGPLEHEQFDLVFNLLAVRNVAKFAEPLFEAEASARSDWHILTGLTQRIALLKQGKSLSEMDTSATGVTPEQMLDFALQSGPYGRGFDVYQGDTVVDSAAGLSLKELKKYPHGLDLGPLQPRLPEHLFTDNQKICLLPEAVLGDLQRLYDGLAALPQTDELLLIGRRDLRTNNSWMHNSQRLVKGQDRCALFIHPQDAERLGLADRSKASIRSRVGSLEVDVKYQTDIMPGVVSLPHGWGHDRPGIALRVAQTNPGISVNDITDDQRVDKLSGNAIFNGIPVTVAAV